MSDILIVNKSTLVSSADILAWIPIANQHYAQEFGPVWGVQGTWYFGDAPVGAWVFTLQDGIGQPSDLAYHYTDATGKPDAFIDAQAAAASGTDWRQPLDHEGKEALVDPSCTLFCADGSTLRECADPVEEELIIRSNMPFSNFVYPEWCGLATGTKFDFNGMLTAGAPSTAPGGYVERWMGGQYIITYGMKARLNPGYMASRLTGRRAFRAANRPPPAPIDLSR
jgi:hypothetical protein